MPRQSRPADRSDDGRRHDRVARIRWIVMGVWAVLLVVRLVLASTSSVTGLTVLGVVQVLSIVAGVVVVGLGFGASWSRRARQADAALAGAVRRIDPTARIVPATPTRELRDVVAHEHPDVELTERVLWGFGATEASLWQLDDRRAVRVLVVQWNHVVHVGVEDVEAPGRQPVAVIALHFVRGDGASAAATFAVRRDLGAGRVLRRGSRLERLATDLAAERYVGR